MSFLNPTNCVRTFRNLRIIFRNLVHNPGRRLHQTSFRVRAVSFSSHFKIMEKETLLAGNLHHLYCILNDTRGLIIGRRGTWGGGGGVGVGGEGGLKYYQTDFCLIILHTFWDISTCCSFGGLNFVV